MIPSTVDITAAAARIAPYAHRTPVMVTQAFGRRIEVKLENTQVTGSFKARGAFNTLVAGPVPQAGVVAASGGNHGAAVAQAAKTLGYPAHIFVPEYAGPAKIALIRRTGADLTIVPGTYAEALAAAQAFEARTGAMQIHAFDATRTLEGQGTLFREWDEQGLEADTVLIAVGGGGLIGGAMAWWQGRRKVVAVEPQLAPTLHEALAQGPETVVKVGGIAANALGATRIGRMCYDLAVLQGVQAVLVSEDAIAEAQKALWTGLRQYVEPAGAAALAALTSRAYVPEDGERVAVLVCGANPAQDPFA
ncbi:MAG: serine/threonine dehydratase [Rhodobacterales bacterium]|nr:serine/threonine dehydratase [Rhodobacterales bacterium]